MVSLVFIFSSSSFPNVELFNDCESFLVYLNNAEGINDVLESIMDRKGSIKSQNPGAEKYRAALHL